MLRSGHAYLPWHELCARALRTLTGRRGSGGADDGDGASASVGMPPQLPATAAAVAAVARTLLTARELIADSPGANAGTSVIPPDARVYLPELHGAERTVAAALARLAAAPARVPHARKGPRNLRAWLDAAETSLGVTLSAEQRDAVASAAKERVLVLTGGPGTGKTFVVTLAVRLWLQQGLRVRCVASAAVLSSV
jgi:hypothetical protein